MVSGFLLHRLQRPWVLSDHTRSCPASLDCCERSDLRVGLSGFHFIVVARCVLGRGPSTDPVAQATREMPRTRLRDRDLH